MLKKCQIFTPHKNVITILDEVGYIKNLYGKKILENACGDGNILIEVVRRYVEDSIKYERTISDIKFGLERDVFGAEIDKIHYKNCLKNLDNIVKIYNIINVKWNILNIDILKTNLQEKFDFIVGNPPYITYRDLDLKNREFIRKEFNTCKCGKFDYYYAFIEKSIKDLKINGKLAYLIPNNVFKNVFARELRNMILPFVERIVDYTTLHLFTNVLTSSAIIICDKSSKKDFIEYYDVVKNKEIEIKKKELSQKWIFSNDIKSEGNLIKFGDYFSVSIAVATLLNEAYVIKKFTVDKDYIEIDGNKIEKKILSEAATPKSLLFEKDELIIFPYKYNRNNKLLRYNKEDFEKEFPETTKYLKRFEKQLQNRKSDKSVEWFEYGRTQALAHINQPKILLSTIITGKAKANILGKRVIPYSGIYIVAKKELPLSKAKEILESDSFYEYAKKIGINVSGNSVRVTPKDIINYEFN